MPTRQQPTDRLGLSIARLDQLKDRDTWLDRYGTGVTCVISHAMAGLSNEVMARLPSLRLIANLGAGVDLIDLNAARARNIIVTATGDALADDVADLAMLHCLTLLRGTRTADQFERSGEWLRGPPPLSRSAKACRMGILGFGRIGKAIARRAEASGMMVGCHSRHALADAAQRYFDCPLQLAEWAEVLIVALPGGPQTQSMVGRQMLDALGRQGYVVNIARGGIVDERELCAALEVGRIAGAGLDVFIGEPVLSPAIITAPNLLMTPHLGSATHNARDAMLDQLVANILAFDRGEALSGIVA